MTPLEPLAATAHRAVLLSAFAALGALAFWLLLRPECASAGVLAAESELSTAAARALEAKIQVLSERDAKPASSYPPVIITEAEANSYFKLHGHEFLPAGVRDTKLRITREGVSGAAEVDFNQLNQAAAKSDNLGRKIVALIFRGRQPVRATGKLETSNGQGKLTIENVTVGTLDVPDWLVNVLVENYVHARYDIDLSKPFALPDHVSHIELGAGRATFHRSATKSQ